MSLWDGSFGNLLSSVNLKGIPNTTRDLLSGFSGFGKDYLNDQGTQSLFNYYADNANDMPGGRMPTNRNWARYQYGTVLNQYNVAAAADPTLKFNNFLENYDWNKLYNQTSARDRGEFPGAFTRGFRFLSGG